MAPGGTGILDDSSLMVDNTSAESSYLRLDIGWLLEFCPDDFSINYSEGGVSFQQKDNYLYLYFPNGIGQDTYADPGYFSIGVTLGEAIDEIRIPGSDGYYVPGTGDWVFPIHVVESTADMSGRSAPTGTFWSEKSGRQAASPHPGCDCCSALYRKR